MQTPWDYTVNELPPILSVADFKSLYPTMSSTDDEIESVLCATSQAIRDYCGWHVSPELECTFTGDGEGNILVLPAMGVTEVESLTINDVDTPCEFRSSGLVRINGRFPDVRLHRWIPRRLACSSRGADCRQRFGGSSRRCQRKSRQRLHHLQHDGQRDNWRRVSSAA